MLVLPEIDPAAGCRLGGGYERDSTAACRADMSRGSTQQLAASQDFLAFCVARSTTSQTSKPPDGDAAESHHQDQRTYNHDLMRQEPIQFGCLNRSGQTP